MPLERLLYGPGIRLHGMLDHLCTAVPRHRVRGLTAPFLSEATAFALRTSKSDGYDESPSSRLQTSLVLDQMSGMTEALTPRPRFRGKSPG